ncbi:single-stranded DNA-binding protein [Demequina zhanjiangensis]|uniref:Single-stranded DNA-binding protein n=1 Tax=Demequina zhanjiangensis TaxID=3051659 RepID=A0ABT8G4U5_9MICO|nr:single-stranded DNA-binding protein [Demequina sp. SYSU T00b26]MDN4473734.1 single-stranded DNA-binding protein [Demequina sp. SYSU T00b26]
MAYVATGRVASEPDFHELPDGSAICTFRLASSRRDRCGNPQTEWFTVRAVEDAVAARDLARKGAHLTVSGTLRAAPRESGTAGPAGMLIDSASVAAADD